MENLVVVWYLHMSLFEKSWSNPAPYPTKNICEQVGKDYFRQGSGYRLYFCIPAPVLIQSNDFRDKLFKEKK